VVLTFLAAACLLAVSIVFIYCVGLRAVEDDQKSERALSALNRLQDFFSDLTDAETGQRGYLLTGEEPYLQPYTSVRSRVQTELDGLRQLALTGDFPKDKVDRVVELTQQKLHELDQTIQVRRDKGLGAALVLVNSNRGEQFMDEIRVQIGLIRTIGQNKLKEATSRANQATRIRSWTFIAVGLLNLAFLAWAFRIISREVGLRETAVSETQRDKELLAITLASIGDAVIVTNAEGRITSLNTEAEKLTGWKSSEARDQALPNVFRIINEQTRQPAENPVDKVLRHGAVMGLANHTLLISRNGAELPIDDSAAPIRLSDGSLLGVVLVFRDFTEQRLAQLVLERSKEELERLVGERTTKLKEMVEELEHVSYAITHDMRAPLRAMSAFASLVSERTVSWKDQETSDYCRRIQVAASRLDKLIQDALHYTKAVLREMPPEPVDLSKLVPSLIETYPNLQPDKADIHIEGQLPVVLGNDALLTQCFSNLLGNAVKFVASGTRPHVRVHSETNGTMTRIWVQDNGIGIPQHSRERLFKMFQRLTNDHEGTGIGLAIVRKSVERMGGKVGSESEAGKGSQFWMELRLANPPE
jgi:PAS domain S-box-containing protein